MGGYLLMHAISHNVGLGIKAFIFFVLALINSVCTHQTLRCPHVNQGL